jgi:hypothetical protein
MGPGALLSREVGATKPVFAGDDWVVRLHHDNSLSRISTILCKYPLPSPPSEKMNKIHFRVGTCTALRGPPEFFPTAGVLVVVSSRDSWDFTLPELRIDIFVTSLLLATNPKNTNLQNQNFTNHVQFRIPFC